MRVFFSVGEGVDAAARYSSVQEDSLCFYGIVCFEEARELAFEHAPCLRIDSAYGQPFRKRLGTLLDSEHVKRV